MGTSRGIMTKDGEFIPFSVFVSARARLLAGMGNTELLQKEVSTLMNGSASAAVKVAVKDWIEENYPELFSAP